MDRQLGSVKLTAIVYVEAVILSIGLVEAFLDVAESEFGGKFRGAGLFFVAAVEMQALAVCLYLDVDRMLGSLKIAMFESIFNQGDQHKGNNLGSVHIAFYRKFDRQVVVEP